jgi:hypothetical protein
LENDFSASFILSYSTSRLDSRRFYKELRKEKVEKNSSSVLKNQEMKKKSEIQSHVSDQRRKRGKKKTVLFFQEFFASSKVSKVYG